MWCNLLRIAKIDDLTVEPRLSPEGGPLATGKVEVFVAQAFMSYASTDAIFADLAKMKLKEAGVQVWIDQGALRAGEEWRNAIDEGISSSDVLMSYLRQNPVSHHMSRMNGPLPSVKGLK